MTKSRRQLPCCLYRYFDTEDRLLYVGAAINPLVRLIQHRAGSDWLYSAATLTMEWHADQAAALKAEREAIHAERPLHNSYDEIGQRQERAKKAASEGALRLAEWLSAEGVSQAELADRISVHYSLVSYIIAGQRRPRIAVAENIERVTKGAVKVAMWPRLGRPKRDVVRDAKVAAMVADGLTDFQIAKQIGIASTTVTKARHLAGLPKNKKRRSSKHEAALRELAKQGLNKSQAAEQLGIHQPTVVRLAQTLGIEFADGRKGSKHPARLSHVARVERVRNLAAEGLTVTQVAKVLGVAQPEVSRLKKRYSIQFGADRGHA